MVFLLAFAVAFGVTVHLAAVVAVFLPDEVLVDDVLLAVQMCNLKSNSFIFTDGIIDAKLEEDVDNVVLLEDVIEAAMGKMSILSLQMYLLLFPLSAGGS